MLISLEKLNGQKAIKVEKNTYICTLIVRKSRN